MQLNTRELLLIMGDSKELVWNGSINVQIKLDSRLLVDGVPEGRRLVNIRVPRESYIAIYTPLVLERLRNVLRSDIEELLPKVWYSYKDISLPWSIPFGTLFDIYNGAHKGISGSRDNYINVWKLNLVTDEKFPINVIPIIEGQDQLRKFMMQRWKQCCFILNGSSKRVMSLSLQDSLEVWEGVTERDYAKYSGVIKRIMPRTPRRIPVAIHAANGGPIVQTTEPTLTDTSFSQAVEGIVKADFVVCQGIVMYLRDFSDTSLYDVYDKLHSIDGYLHLIANL